MIVWFKYLLTKRAVLKRSEKSLSLLCPHCDQPLITAYSRTIDFGLVGTFICQGCDHKLKVGMKWYE